MENKLVSCRTETTDDSPLADLAQLFMSLIKINCTTS